jgi:hypothetical protein
MSADNGIYILSTIRNRRETSQGCWGERFEHRVYRVAHAQAIDNFQWYKDHEPYNIGAYMVDTWGKSVVYTSAEDALHAAEELAKTIEYLEYGIVSITNTQYVFYGDL